MAFSGTLVSFFCFHALLSGTGLAFGNQMKP